MKSSRRRQAETQEFGAPRTVWLVYEEFQADTPAIAGIYLRRADAEKVAEECRREARSTYGWVVFGDRDALGRCIAEWDVDVHLEEHLVRATTGRLNGLES
jgi:hypothetical protein